MTTTQRQLAHEIRELTVKLTVDGWDRLRGLRLAHTATGTVEECRRIKWMEAIGRASELADLFCEFAQEAPKESSLKYALKAAAALADLLEAGQHAAHVERDFLPARPQEWLFVLASHIFDSNAELAGNLASLGFSVIRVENIDDAAEACQADQVILIAAASWLTENPERIAALLPTTGDSFPASVLLVAIADTDDFRTQVKARQVGARLLLDPPLDVTRLITELAGLAWMPRNAYRVMLVDDDTAVMTLHANILQAAGFEVLAIDDPVAARDFLGDFAPEACVLDVEMPACRGTDLAALLRRDKRYTRLPIIYLSAFADINHQLDARHAGGEDYLVKPVDTRLLVTAVMARTQQFRMLEAAYRQRRHAWRQLDNLRTAMDAHAVVSIAAADGTIIDANCQFCELSGYSREELIGRNHRIVKSGRHPADFFEGMWQTLSEGRIWQGEIQNRRKDGGSYWVQSTIVPILDEFGVPEQYIAIRTDITVQKSIQAKRQHQTRLLNLLCQAFQQYITDRDIGVTSALLLEGMLLLIDSASGFLGEVLYDPDGLPYLKTHALINVAWDNTLRGLYMEKQVAGMESLNLDSLINKVLSTGGVVIANDSAESNPLREDFICIPIYYGEALIGIVGLANPSDAYDVSTIGDFLQSFTATYASILEAARVRHFRQQVMLDLQQARDDAERANQAKSVFLANWGLELHRPLNAMLSHIKTLQMNDTLEAETRQKVVEIAKDGQRLTHLISGLFDHINAKGSAKIPQESKTPIIAEAQRNSDSEKRRILVAEDNPANQAVLRMQLGVLGFIADIAADGATAMLKWQAGGHDLILTDRNMPGMDGLELTRAIRATERETGAYVPIIAITAAQHPEEISLCRQAGMDDVLPKPIELDDLRNMLERWLPHASPLASRNGEANMRIGENKAILDTDYLARIIGNADPKQKRELIDLFTTTARHDLPACREHLAERNGHKLSLVMHKLKSSAGMVGALVFSHLAENLESVAKANRLDAAANLLTELEHALSDVETAVSRLGVSVVSTIHYADTVSITADMRPGCVLIVDDDPVARRQIAMLLYSLGVHEVRAVESAEVALIEIARADGGIDLLVSDLKMPGMDGIEFLRHLADNNYRSCIIIASGVEEQLLQTAAEMVRAKGMNLRGILKKPVTQDALLRVLTGACETTTAPSAQREQIAITPDDIQKGIRDNEFEVHFQPKVDAARLRVVGMEALARWQHNGQMISPDVFISMAERHGLIGELSELLVTKALVGGARLAEAGYFLTIAVNLSANWLSDIRLPEFILANVQATGFKAENLILEITETGVMADMATALDVMTRLRLKGFKLSIDDFGTGYSSMEQLQRIPFGELKLDRSFVQGAIEKTAARAILASTIEMAKKMRLSTVAEGVEIQAELDLVRGLGCDLVQGWFVAKAMPMDALLVWLKERNA
ncbi:MAG: EAL domain-containing protein [Methylobacter sp.]|nr:EAL domain-containing protein [Methylobacter sp.]